MDIALVIAAGGLGLLALAHSGLGDSGFIRPLIAAGWSVEGVPRWAADGLLRATWHFTSIAWIGLAAAAVGVSPLVAAGIVALVSGALMFWLVRPHFAWPVLVVAGAAALWADDALPSVVLVGAAALAVAALAAAGLLHVCWAFGGRWGISAAIPTDADGSPAFAPPPMLTLAVAGALWALAGLVAARAAGVAHWAVTAAVAVGVLVLAIRAIGDGRQAGFSKSDRSTTFAKADDAVFTPLVVLLALGGGAALLV